jgi:hypothetical protein
MKKAAGFALGMDRFSTIIKWYDTLCAIIGLLLYILCAYLIGRYVI